MGVSLTVMGDTSRNLWSPQVVSTQPQQYVVVPAASTGPLVAYGNPQDVSQFVQPVMPFQQVSGNQVAALGFLGRQAPAPEGALLQLRACGYVRLCARVLHGVWRWQVFC